MKFGSFRAEQKEKIFARCRASKFNVRAIPIGDVALFSWNEYKSDRPNATHDNFAKALRQACYRAKPMKFRTAVYDDYETGAMAVERLS